MNDRIIVRPDSPTEVVRAAIARFFDPCLTVRYTNGRWTADRVEQYKLMQQFRREAGVNNDVWPDPSDAYDRILAAACKHGWSLEYHGDRWRRWRNE